MKTATLLACIEKILKNRDVFEEEKGDERRGDILVIEDDPFQSGILKNFLAQEKFNTHQAFNMKEVRIRNAENILSTGTFNLQLLQEEDNFNYTGWRVA